MTLSNIYNFKPRKYFEAEFDHMGTWAQIQWDIAKTKLHFVFDYKFTLIKYNTICRMRIV